MPQARGGAGCRERPSAVSPWPGVPCTPTAAAATVLVLPKQHLTHRELGAVSGWASQRVKAEILQLGSGLCKEGPSSSRPGAASAGPAPQPAAPARTLAPRQLQELPLSCVQTCPGLVGL